MDREALIAKLNGHGPFDPRVLRAIAAVDRALFVPPELFDEAWEDRALPIGLGQTVSQPLIVAMMSQALSLTGQEQVLEVGTGSGYQTAVLSHLCHQVFSVELLPRLAQAAERRLQRLGLTNIRLRQGDGALGWPEEAPFDAVMVTAAPEFVPPELVAQLRDGGKMVIPVGRQGREQRLVLLERRAGSAEPLVRELGSVSFVPLVESAQRGKLELE